MSLQVSVVVPTYKRPALLRHCLDMLIHQDFPSEAYEIIVVDDAASDEVRSLIEQVKITATPSCPEVIYEAATQTQGPAAARNIGWRKARGEIIAFTDDDCLPQPDWLKEGIAAFEDEIVGVSGQVIVPIPIPPTDYQKNVARLTNGEFVTANCFYRRRTLEDCGGFDEQFTMAWREDSELQFRLITLSCRLVHAPWARVIHPVRYAPWGISIKEQRKSMFEALLFKKYPQLYRQRIVPVHPCRYYLTVASLVAGIVALSFNAALLAWILFGFWIGLTVQFAFQRLKQTKHTFSHIAEMMLTSAVIPPLSVFWRVYGAFYYRVYFF